MAPITATIGMFVGLGGACYTPNVGDCTYTCGPNLTCPSGLSCAGGFCRIDPGSTTPCPPLGDDALDMRCGFEAFPPTHFDPCAVAAAPDWVITTDVIYNTDNGSGAGGPQGLLLDQTPAGPTQIRVVRVGSFRVNAGGRLTVNGGVPLVVAADAATIGGGIDVFAGVGAPPFCAAAASSGSGTADACGGGGSGGGFGGIGGSFSPCDGSVSVPVITPIAGDPMQSMLSGGCSGANGGNNITGFGAGGAGGGALQISATTSIDVLGGWIAAPGRAGYPGQNSNGNGGGGGGGAGGAIFLEAPVINISNSSQVCASGGGGGEGSSASAGLDGQCNTPAMGGSGTNGGDGGVGGYGSAAAGSGGPASPGSMTCNGAFCSGGGGGGGVGRIRLRRNMGDISGVVTPAPVP